MFSRSGWACGVAHFFYKSSLRNSSRLRLVSISQSWALRVRTHDGAMALAAAAVGGFSIVICKQLIIVQLERTLTLIANGEIDIKLVIEDRDATGNKRKRKASKTSVWKVEQPYGAPQPFSDTLWGGATCDFMTLLHRVPKDAMARIIDEASLVVKSQKTKATVVNSEQQSDRAALSFH